MTSKTKTVWCCTECGHSQTRWAGQCPACHEWNTLHEESALPPPTGRFQMEALEKSKPVRLGQVSLAEVPRQETGIAEFDRVLGGGVVPGSLSLLGGNPGIGKSTLLMQAADALAQKGWTILYICGEESVEQTSMRAQRLGVTSDNIHLLNETNFSVIQPHIENLRPHVVIVDSIQILYKPDLSSAPGSVSQVRETALEFLHLAKGHGISTFLIGHVTKSGEIAGPRVLEHIVDTVLYFEGDKHLNYRMVRAVKNRFGASDEVAVFQMVAAGLRQVENPSQIFLEERSQHVSGSAIISTIEGTRPLLIEVQALVTDTVFSTPSRRSTGVDSNRLALLLAVLEKRMGYQLHRSDVFVSIAGGAKIIEPASDLGILLAIASSFSNRRIDHEAVVIGEVGLGGEVRAVSRAETRIKEAWQMGFQRCLIPKRCLKGISQELLRQGEILTAETVEEAIHALIAHP